MGRYGTAFCTRLTGSEEPAHGSNEKLLYSKCNLHLVESGGKEGAGTVQSVS